MLVTVTVAVAFFPLLDVAVIVAVPLCFPLIMPLTTVAMCSLLDVQVIFLLVAFDGLIVAFIVAGSLEPVPTFIDFVDNVTDVTAILLLIGCFGFSV